MLLPKLVSFDSPPPKLNRALSSNGSAEETKQSISDARRAIITAMAKKILLPLTKYQKPYVSSRALEKFDIRCKDMDFKTGQVGPRVEPFIEPIPPHLVEEWLNETKPWTVRDDFVNDPDPDPWFDDDCPTNDAQTTATFFGILIDIHLSSNEKEEEPGIMVAHTNWGPFPPYCGKYVNRLSAGHGMRNWQLKATYRQNIVPATCRCIYDGTLDADKPHAICFLADDAPIQDDLIATSELTSLLFVAIDIALKAEFEKHRIIPVTLVTGSLSTIRIVQAICDFEKGTIELRKSPPVHFPKGVRADWQKYLTLLGWILGKPVGQTT
ncbi:endothelin-converting enzyme [Fusarium albosuccineum]|uniref:Endothelin-converting enzyme n=1 Tax=Fusarium albosuccineum TaxID=1237068 RepID=A0A8H4KMA0_9HYPO|nr:endothelin-converting enzyme [Fusarium albosuccineum]